MDISQKLQFTPLLLQRKEREFERLRGEIQRLRKEHPNAQRGLAQRQCSEESGVWEGVSRIGHQLAKVLNNTLFIN